MTSLTANGAPSAAPMNRGMVVASVMLGTIITVLDMTIANVALPHMAGSVSASSDQIAWVLTSYIVTSAIMTPLTGFLASRLGRKRLMMLSVAAFIACSALCGAAQTLPMLVLFRVLQGAAAAPLQPLSQAIILDLFTVAERGPAMAVWSIGVMVAPIVGPVLGGWLTDAWSWRWVFYINLPIGALCLLGVTTFMPADEKKPKQPFGLAGFAMLSIAIASAQLMLDRGQGQGWFDSSEIWLEGAVALIAFWFFLVHSFTSSRPFLPMAIFKDRNFVTAACFGVLISLLIFSMATVLPMMMQSLFGFSVVTTGLVIAPRGLGGVISMFVVGRLIGRWDTRTLLVCGLSIFSATFFHMSEFTLDTSMYEIALNGFFQGLGTGFIFLPMTALAFSTVPGVIRPDATSVYALIRNFGGSGGISIVLALLTNLTIAARSALITPYSLDNTGAQSIALPPQFDLTNPAGVIMLSNEVDRQAAMVAYSELFRLMSLGVLVLMPFLLFLRPVKTQTPPEEAMVVE